MLVQNSTAFMASDCRDLIQIDGPAFDHMLFVTCTNILEARNFLASPWEARMDSSMAADRFMHAGYCVIVQFDFRPFLKETRRDASLRASSPLYSGDPGSDLQGTCGRFMGQRRQEAQRSPHRGLHCGRAGVVQTPLTHSKA